MNFVGSIASRLILREPSYLHLPYPGRHHPSVLSQDDAIAGQETEWLKMLTSPQRVNFKLYINL